MSLDRITSKLEHWYAHNKREMPWRGVHDPYYIWLSEVILQQTRVEQGLPYYEHFVSAFPDVHALATAPLEHVLKAWEGLGYYSRARNLHKAAKLVHGEMNGVFPKNYVGLLNLPGVGPYTAAAIASICYGEKVPVVDGNVNRFISRLFGIMERVDAKPGRALIHNALDEMIDYSMVAGDFNQALMEFGATECAPKKPNCQNCLFIESCVAFRENTVNQLPMKKQKVSVKKRYFDYHVFLDDGHTFIQQRTDKDIWKGLYEFNLTEYEKSPTEPPPNEAIHTANYKHVLSHQHIFARFIVVELPENYDATSHLKIPLEDLSKYPFSRLTTRFLEEWKLGEREA